MSKVVDRPLALYTPGQVAYYVVTNEKLIVLSVIPCQDHYAYMVQGKDVFRASEQELMPSARVPKVKKPRWDERDTEQEQFQGQEDSEQY